MKNSIYEAPRKAVVIIPAYRPTEQLCRTVQALLASSFDKIIVVDDGSGKAFEPVFQKVKAMGCDFLTHAENRGKGRALKTAFEHFMSSYIDDYFGVITVDADGQHMVPDVLRMKEALFEHPDSLVLGCRNFGGQDVPLRSRLGNRITRGIMRFLCGLEILDTQTGLRAISAGLLRTFMETPGERYEYEMNMLLEAQKNCCPFYQVPIKTVYYNNNESSHFKPLKDSLRIYERIFKYTLSSLLSVIIDFGIFILLNQLGNHFILYTYISRVCSSLVNFTLNRNVVFGNKQGSAGASLVKYYLLLFFSGGVSGIFVTVMHNTLSLNPVVGKMLADTALFFLNYYIQKVFVFKSERIFRSLRIFKQKILTRK